MQRLMKFLCVAIYAVTLLLIAFEIEQQVCFSKHACKVAQEGNHTISREESVHAHSRNWLGIYQYILREEQNGIFSSDEGELRLKQHKLQDLTEFQNSSSSSKEDFMACYQIHMGINFHFPICTYHPDADAAISKSVTFGQPYEKDDLRAVLFFLSLDKNMGFIDLGANIGTYSLPIAKLGYEVLAVEPLLPSAKRILHAATLSKFDGKLKVLLNAISDTHGFSRMAVDATNRGRATLDSPHNCTHLIAPNTICSDLVTTVTINDLLPIITFKRAIMKIDIEAYEIKALRASSNFLNHIDIPLIVMEWEWYAKFYKQHLSDRRIVDDFLGFMRNHSYIPCDIKDNQLSVNKWHSWPLNVYWHKKLHIYE